MFKHALVSLFLFSLVSSSGWAVATLSSQLEFYVKQNAGLQQQCDDELKALPLAESAALDSVIKAVKDSPRFPKATADMLTALNTTSLPSDKTDIHASVEILNKAPLCWSSNSMALIYKGAQRVIESGTKEQKDDFTAALVNRLRTENKKQLLLLPVMVYLQSLNQLAKANLLNAAVRPEIEQAYASGKALSEKFHEQFPDLGNAKPDAPTEAKDEKQNLEARKSELSSTREIQAQIDSILKKI